MNTNHTPGPWEASGTVVYFPDLSGGFDIRNCPRPEANARLIASAPDLLESLERLIAQCERLRLPGQPPTDAEKTAAEVIAKATGAV